MARPPLPWVLGVAALAAITGLIPAGMWWRGSGWRERVYRIGFQDSRPAQWRDASGLPQGPAVDYLRTAAARRGVRLEWVYLPEGPDAAILEGKAELWPLAVFLPERRKYMHFTDPYVTNTFLMITVRGRSAGPRILHLGDRFARAIVAERFPNAQVTTGARQSGLLDALCRGEGDMVLTGTSQSDRPLESKSPACAAYTLQIKPVDGWQNWLGIAARRSDRQVVRAADELRTELGAMGRDGTYSTITLSHGLRTANDIATIEGYVESRRQRLRLQFALAGCLLLLAGLVWQQLRLRKASARAAAASRAKSDFLARVSHEIRTPMSGVAGLSDLLLGTSLDAEQHDYARNIKAAANSLIVVINDLLDLASVERGRLSLRSETFSPAAALRTTVNLLEPQARRKGLWLRSHLPEAGNARGDAGRFSQIATNLIGNAIKFTQTGGVSVKLEQRPEASGWRIRLEVEDTGIGIPAADLKLLFQDFSRLERGAPPTQGSGLGLAISRELAGLMGGRIGVEPARPHGSLFWFEVYLPGADAAAASGPPALPGAVPSGKHVLVVDDNDVNRRIGVRMLEKLGCRADSAVSGEDALALAGQRRYDLILMDWELPGIDGLEATRRLRQAGAASAAAPVIALTANAMHGDREKCLAAGVSDYLTKPLDLARLAEAVSRWAGREATPPPGAPALPRHPRTR